MLFTIFIKSLRNLLLPDILKLFLLCLIVYAAGMGLLAWVFSRLINSFIAGFGDGGGSEGFALHFLGSAGGMMAAWFLFPLFYPILVSFFDDPMASVIERADYPQLPPAVPPFFPTVLNDLWFSVKALGLNLLCLPLYFIPLAGLAVYYGLNGYLLGTQFFRIAAGRRVTMAEADALRRQAHHSILFAGVAISFFSTVPVLNLAAPLVGVAAMVHLFHAVRGTEKQERLP